MSTKIETFSAWGRIFQRVKYFDRPSKRSSTSLRDLLLGVDVLELMVLENMVEMLIESETSVARSFLVQMKRMTEVSSQNLDFLYFVLDKNSHELTVKNMVGHQVATQILVTKVFQK